MNALKYQWHRALGWLMGKHGFSEQAAKLTLVGAIILYFVVVPFPLDILIVLFVAFFGNDGTQR